MTMQPRHRLLVSRSVLRIGTLVLAFIALSYGVACSSSRPIRKDAVADEPSARRAPLDLAAVGIHLVAVVELLDRTEQNAGVAVAESLKNQLVARGTKVLPTVIRRPAPILAREWLGTLAGTTGATGVVSGTVTGYAIQKEMGRAYVSLSAIMYDVVGKIMWSRRVKGVYPFVVETPGTQVLPIDAPMRNNHSNTTSKQGSGALQLAATIAAKEFANDFFHSP